MLVFRHGECTPAHDYLLEKIGESIDTGIVVVSDIKERRNKIDRQVSALKSNVESYYGIDNINSAVKIRQYFESVLTGNELDLCNKKGKITFDKESLEKLAKLGRADAADIIRYRSLKKTLDTLDGLVGAIDRDGRIHPEISVSKTNRLNYLNPALMNIPKDLLWNVISPRREGGKLYSVDIKFQEPWILIHMLGIEQLIDIMTDEPDFYNAIHKAVFKVDCPNKETRDNIKTIWNAMSYGATLYGIREYSKCIDGEAIYRYFESIKEYKEYKGKCYGRSKKNTQVVETYFGTELTANEYGSKLARALMDLPIQGTGADILALLVENFDRQMAELGLASKLEIYYTRHDELVIDSDGTIDDVIVLDILEKTLQHQVDDWLPFRLTVSLIEHGNGDK